MIDRIALRIPFRIVPKARPRVAKSKFNIHTYMPDDYSRCVANIKFLLNGLVSKGWDKFTSYEVSGCFVVQSSKDGDLDNLIGTVLDAGNGLLWHDDRQVVAFPSLRKEIGINPAAAIEITVSKVKTGFEPKKATIAKAQAPVTWAIPARR